MPRRSLSVLVTGLTVLIATFAVLMAFQSLFSALGDVVAARVLFGFVIACLVLLVVDVLLLVGVLGMHAIWEQRDREQRDREQRDREQRDREQRDRGQRSGGSGYDAGN